MSTQSGTALIVRSANLAINEVDDEAPERLDPLVDAVPVAAPDVVAPFVKTTAAMELPGGIEKDELGVALSYAIMLGGGAPSAPNGAAKSTPAVQPVPGQCHRSVRGQATSPSRN